MTALQLLDDIILELESAIAASGSASRKEMTVTAAIETSSDSLTKNPNKEIKKEKKKGSDSGTNSSCIKGQPTASKSDAITINSIDLRVGVIVNVKRHETADKLYCEEVRTAFYLPLHINQTQWINY